MKSRVLEQKSRVLEPKRVMNGKDNGRTRLEYQQRVCWADAVDGLHCSRAFGVYYAMTCVLDWSAPQQGFCARMLPSMKRDFRIFT